MKRPIKFRGRYSDCDPTFYAGLKEISLIHNPDENSIAQLVGYDRDGKEIYEGDKVISPNGYEYTAELCGYPTLKNFKLKEDSK